MRKIDQALEAALVQAGKHGELLAGLTLVLAALATFWVAIH